MNALIIEDHPITALGTTQILKKNFDGIKIQSATDGVETLNELNENVFEIIIMDIVLPDTDSYRILMV